MPFRKLIVKYRAFSKTVTWRITASIITIAIVYSLTGSMILAFSVFGIEFFTKIFLYYIHEKLWSFSSRPPKGSQIRSVIKTVSWRITATLDTILILLIIIRKPIYAGLGAGLEVALKSLAYYVHERIWNRYRMETIESKT